MDYPLFSSNTNPLVKKVKKLQQKKFREELQSFLVENFTLISDARVQGMLPSEILVTEEAYKKNSLLIDKLAEEKVPVTLITDKIIAYLSQLETPPGVIAVYAIPALPTTFDSTQSMVYLNGINDPGNVGTIIRTAVAFGLKTIICDETCADVYNLKTIQAAKNAVFNCTILFDNMERTLLATVHKTMPLVAMTTQGSRDIEPLHKTPICLILGNESRGIDAAVQQDADYRLQIPIENIESLNVAITAGICLYEMKQLTT